MKQPLVLKVYRDGQLVNVQQFSVQQVVFGRGGDAQIALEDDSVSPIHALLEERDGKTYLSDLGSQTGTYLSGKRVLETEIKSGEEIKIGPFSIHFFVGVPKPVVIPPSASGTEVVAPPTPPPPPPIPDLPKEENTFATGMDLRTPDAENFEEPPDLPLEDDEKPIVAGGFTETPRTDQMQISPMGEFNVGPTHFPQHVGITTGKTFAPASVNKDPKELVSPGKGSMVEVVVFWHERAISTDHFNPKNPITIGGSKNADVFVPVLPKGALFTFVKGVQGQAVVCLTPDMTGELVRFNDSISLKELAKQNKFRDGGGHYELDLKQGEMVRVSFMDGVVSLVVRYKEATQRPLAVPLLDLTTSEITGVILAVVISSILGLYMAVYSPADLDPDEAMIEEPIRKAIVKFNPPPKQVVVAEEKPAEAPPEKKVLKVAEKAPDTKPAAAPRQAKEVATPKEGAPGKAGEVAPSKTPSKNKQAGSARPGGSVKTADKEAANAKSVKPDPMKTGLFSAFGSKGVQSQLDKAYSGSGELQGLADQATGTSGMAETRPGDGIGTKMKEGASGKGESIVGIAGVGTKGRGTGTTGYGTGGIGKKGSVDIEVGGDGAGFVGSIDKDAIRRVIREHLREIRTCYERALQRQPELYGKIVFSWVIAERGRVQSAKVISNDLGNTEVANCIKSKLQTWTFPEPPPNTLAEVDSYPFVFASQ